MCGPARCDSSRRRPVGLQDRFEDVPPAEAAADVRQVRADRRLARADAVAANAKGVAKHGHAARRVAEGRDIRKSAVKSSTFHALTSGGSGGFRSLSGTAVGGVITSATRYVRRR